MKKSILNFRTTTNDHYVNAVPIKSLRPLENGKKLYFAWLDLNKVPSRASTWNTKPFLSTKFIENNA